MEVNELKNQIVKAVKIKYPNKRSIENRFIDLMRQVGGFGESLQFHRGNLPKCSQHDTLQHQIASIMVDLFMISDIIEADVEEELLKAKTWFEKGSK